MQLMKKISPGLSTFGGLNVVEQWPGPADTEDIQQGRELIAEEMSGKLLAELDVKLRGRSVSREIGTWKTSNGQPRPFGGLNVICSGDF